MLDFTGTLPQVRKLNDGTYCYAEAEGGSDVRVATAQYCANLFLKLFIIIIIVSNNKASTYNVQVILNT